MTAEDLKKLTQDIVRRACELKNAYTAEQNAPVNYAAVFSQNEGEYQELYRTAQQLGNVVKQTPTGDLFEVGPIDTVSGKLRLLKIRKPDSTRLEQGDADFTVSHYQDFKNTYLPKAGFALIERKDLEMIELMDPSFNARAYFSHPPLDEQLGLK